MFEKLTHKVIEKADCIYMTNSKFDDVCNRVQAIGFWTAAAAMLVKAFGTVIILLDPNDQNVKEAKMSMHKKI